VVAATRNGDAPREFLAPDDHDALVVDRRARRLRRGPEPVFAVSTSRPTRSGGSQQAETCLSPPTTRCKGGTSVLQRSSTNEQRGWNGHPAGSRMRLGGRPGMGTRRSLAPLPLGSASISPFVYGGWGCR